LRFLTRKTAFWSPFLLLIVISNSACTALLFQPSREMFPIPKKYNIEYHDFEIRTQDDLMLHGWYLPARPREDQQVKHKRILFLHGNANNISNHVAAIAWLPAFGYDAYIFDYRGYGKSEGVQGLYGSFIDIEAAIGYVVSQMQTQDKLIVVGQSLGASMGIYTVSQTVYKPKISAYVSIAAFYDYQQVTRDFLSRNWFTWIFKWPLSFTINDDYAPIDYIAQLAPMPVYFLHGKDDQVVPPYHAQILYEAAKQPKSIEILSRGHNDFFLDANNRKQLLAILEKI